MGEHYNSIRRQDDPCARGEGQAQFYPIGHELDKIPQLINGTENTSKKSKNASKAQPDQISDELVHHALGGIDDADKDEDKMRECLTKYFADRKKLRRLTVLDLEENLLQIMASYDNM